MLATTFKLFWTNALLPTRLLASRMAGHFLGLP